MLKILAGGSVWVRQVSSPLITKLQISLLHGGEGWASSLQPSRLRWRLLPELSLQLLPEHMKHVRAGT